MSALSSKQLDEQSRIFRTYVEEADDGIFIASPEGTYLHVNNAGHRMLGYADGELLGLTIADILCDEQFDEVKPELNRTGASDVHLRDWTLIRKDGSRFKGEILAQRLDTGFLLATVRDRTERILEEDRHREIHSRLEKIAGQLPGMIYQFKRWPDGRSCFPYASANIRHIYRVSPEQVRDNADCLLDILHPDDIDHIVSSIEQSANSLQPWHFEYRVRFSDGDKPEVRWLSGNATPEKQDDGSVLWHGYITDITEQKQAQVLQSQLEMQLLQSQKVESIGRLAGGVAHDFNNLLTSILGFSELALGEIPHDSIAASHLWRVMETANRGAVLTQQLLAFARKKIVKPEAINLSDITRHLLPMVERLVGDDVELQYQFEEALGTALIDIGSLEQVIINLVINARDAMPMGGTLKLETCNCMLDESFIGTDAIQGDATLVPGEYVMLAVTDTGNGIHPDIVQRIFEPFFTTKAPGHGTGLGLSTCYGIIKQAGGQFTVSSRLGEGSSFKLFLPRVGLRAMPVPAEPIRPVKRREGRETILLVEDEPTILAVACEALSDLGYKVLTETNGMRALQLADEYPDPIDMLFTDVVMPKMGGKELAARLGIRRPGLKVLYTSGYTGDTIVNRGVLEQGIEFIQKPYTLHALAAKIRDILDADELAY